MNIYPEPPRSIFGSLSSSFQKELEFSDNFFPNLSSNSNISSQFSPFISSSIISLRYSFLSPELVLTAPEISNGIADPFVFYFNIFPSTLDDRFSLHYFCSLVFVSWFI
jgi:hypothetical protein